VLDLFAGSGALGIEALSRGAERVVFVEQDRGALAALRANLEAVGAAPGQAEIRAGDARTALRTARRRRETYDLVLVDPPYRHAAAWGRELSPLLGALLSHGGRVVSESDRRDPLELELEPLDERRYGDTLIRIHGQLT
jgi:16S rRNA (guanine966-N2)-methyltransferase